MILNFETPVRNVDKMFTPRKKFILNVTICSMNPMNLIQDFEPLQRNP